MLALFLAFSLSSFFLSFPAPLSLSCGPAGPLLRSFICVCVPLRSMTAGMGSLGLPAMDLRPQESTKCFADVKGIDEAKDELAVRPFFCSHTPFFFFSLFSPLLNRG